MTKHDGNEKYKTVVIGDYVFTPIKNQFNDKTAYWLSKKGYTIAVYCFAVSNRDDFCMLETNPKNGVHLVGLCETIGIFMDPELKGPLKPIGMQPFARPDRQDGFGYWIPENMDFADQSFCVEFIQNYDVNLRLKTATMGGAEYYFPNEVLSQMAAIIKSTNAVTTMAIETMLDDIASGASYISPQVSRADIERVVRERKIFVVDASVICPEAMPHRGSAFINESRLIVEPAYRKGAV